VGRRSKADLIAAAQRAIAEHGTSVRLNQIADAAGVTSGAILYHYPDIEQLLVEANQAGMERFYNQRLEAVATVEDPAARLRVLIELGVPQGPDDEGVRLLCSLGGEAARNTVYGLLLTSLYDRQVGMYTSVLELGAALGVFTLTQPALTIARNVVALEDAYGYRIMAKHPTLDYATAVELIVDYARMATGHPLPAGTPHGSDNTASSEKEGQHS
jgi:AcrR family transcriptional regulator